MTARKDRAPNRARYSGAAIEQAVARLKGQPVLSSPTGRARAAPRPQPAVTVTLAANSNCTATFIPKSFHSWLSPMRATGSGTVTSSPAGINCGTTCSGSYTSGATVALTAAASDKLHVCQLDRHGLQRHHRNNQRKHEREHETVPQRLAAKILRLPRSAYSVPARANGFSTSMATDHSMDASSTPA